MPSFASVVELENHLQQSVDNVPAAEQALDLATGLIQSYTGQELFLATSTETFPAPRNFTALGGTLVLRQRPIVSVTSITVDGTAETDFTVDDMAGIVYVARTGPVVETSWHPSHRPTVEVVYDHGYTVIPAELKAVCLEVARQVFDNPKGFVQMSVGDVSGSYGSHVEAGVGLALSHRHQRMLAGLRR